MILVERPRPKRPTRPSSLTMRLKASGYDTCSLLACLYTCVFFGGCCFVCVCVGGGGGEVDGGDGVRRSSLISRARHGPTYGP